MPIIPQGLKDTQSNYGKLRVSLSPCGFLLASEVVNSSGNWYY